MILSFFFFGNVCWHIHQIRRIDFGRHIFFKIASIKIYSVVCVGLTWNLAFKKSKINIASCHYFTNILPWNNELTISISHTNAQILFFRSLTGAARWLQQRQRDRETERPIGETQTQTEKPITNYKNSQQKAESETKQKLKCFCKKLWVFVIVKGEVYDKTHYLPQHRFLRSSI